MFLLSVVIPRAFIQARGSFWRIDLIYKAISPTPRLTLDWISRYFGRKAYAAGADQNVARHPQSVRFQA